MSKRRPPTLRNVLSIAAVMVTLLAATAAIALVLATSVLQKMTSDIAASVESVRTIEEAEVTLLLHVRALDRGERRESAAQVRDLLVEARKYVTNGGEEAALQEARVAVDRYFAVAEQALASANDVKLHESAAIDALDHGQRERGSDRIADEGQRRERE